MYHALLMISADDEILIAHSYFFSYKNQKNTTGGEKAVDTPKTRRRHAEKGGKNDRSLTKNFTKFDKYQLSSFRAISRKPVAKWTPNEQ